MIRVAKNSAPVCALLGNNQFILLIILRAGNSLIRASLIRSFAHFAQIK